MQLSKKDHCKKKPNRTEEGHWEGKFWCNCRTRNYRTWLGVKKHGQADKKDRERDEEDKGQRLSRRWTRSVTRSVIMVKR